MCPSDALRYRFMLVEVTHRLAARHPEASGREVTGAVDRARAWVGSGGAMSVAERARAVEAGADKLLRLRTDGGVSTAVAEPAA
jgi:hypothetical protein